MPKKLAPYKLEEEEKKEEERQVEYSLIAQIPEGKLLTSINYFERLNETTYPINTYDVVIYRIEEHPRYYIGTAASHARDALKSGGLFLVDYYGFAGDLTQIKIIVEFEGLIFKEHDKRGGVIIFHKPLNDEWPVINTEEEI